MIKTLPILYQYKNDPSIELAQTCLIAIDKIENEKEEEETNEQHQKNHSFYSIDPAQPHESKDIKVLEELLLNQSNNLYSRYRAMFALRNLNTEESVLALCKGFNDPSALFKHEICYVLGQMAHKASLTTLSNILADIKQHPMVRHEAAEALGNIDSEQVQSILQQYQHDENEIVKQSCLVGLDINDYWNDSTQFDTIET